nr:MAG TPA: hypothetical protein [Caudoviricetes sp.]
MRKFSFTHFYRDPSMKATDAKASWQFTVFYNLV